MTVGVAYHPVAAGVQPSLGCIHTRREGRLSLAGTGRGDRARRGGWGCGPLGERREYGLEHAVDGPVDLGIPAAKHAKPVAVGELAVACRIAEMLPVTGMSTAIGLDDEPAFQADEVHDEFAAWRLTAETMSDRTPLSQPNPQLDLLGSHALPQRACAFVGHAVRRVPSPPTALRAVPPPRSGEGRVPDPAFGADPREAPPIGAHV